MARPGQFCVELHTSAPWARSPDVRDRIAATVARSAARWGGSTLDLTGWTIVFQDGEVDCNVLWRRTGCTDVAERKMTVRSDRAVCVEGTVLPHEIGHALLPLGDPMHWDAGWHDDGAWERLEDAFVADGGCSVEPLSAWEP
jgi:hypothetical protein